MTYKCLLGPKHKISDKCLKRKCAHLTENGIQIFLINGHSRKVSRGVIKKEANERRE